MEANQSRFQARYTYLRAFVTRRRITCTYALSILTLYMNSINNKTKGFTMDALRVLLVNVFKMVTLMGFAFALLGFYFQLEAIREANALYIMDNEYAVELFGLSWLYLGLGAWAMIIGVLVTINLENKGVK